jgi:hypothetical protein
VLLDLTGALLAFGIVFFWWRFGRTKALPTDDPPNKSRIDPNQQKRPVPLERGTIREQELSASSDRMLRQ